MFSSARVASPSSLACDPGDSSSRTEQALELGARDLLAEEVRGWRSCRARYGLSSGGFCSSPIAGGESDTIQAQMQEEQNSGRSFVFRQSLVRCKPTGQQLTAQTKRRIQTMLYQTGWEPSASSQSQSLAQLPISPAPKS